MRRLATLAQLLSDVGQCRAVDQVGGDLASKRQRAHSDRIDRLRLDNPCEHSTKDQAESDVSRIDRVALGFLRLEDRGRRRVVGNVQTFSEVT